MKQKRFEMRVDESEYEDWGKKAEAVSMSLAAWIRERCNDNSENVPRATEVPMEGRRTATPKRKSEFADEVAGRTGHDPGCDCLVCVQQERFIRQQRSK